MSLRHGTEGTGWEAVPHGQRKDVASALASVAVSEADRDQGSGMTHQKANRVTCDQASPEAREYGHNSIRNDGECQYFACGGWFVSRDSHAAVTIYRI